MVADFWHLLILVKTIIHIIQALLLIAVDRLQTSHIGLNLTKFRTVSLGLLMYSLMVRRPASSSTPSVGG